MIIRRLFAALSSQVLSWTTCLWCRLLCAALNENENCFIIRIGEISILMTHSVARRWRLVLPDWVFFHYMLKLVYGVFWSRFFLKSGTELDDDEVQVRPKNDRVHQPSINERVQAQHCWPHPAVTFSATDSSSTSHRAAGCGTLVNKNLLSDSQDDRVTLSSHRGCVNVWFGMWDWAVDDTGCGPGAAAWRRAAPKVTKGTIWTENKTPILYCEVWGHEFIFNKKVVPFLVIFPLLPLSVNQLFMYGLIWGRGEDFVRLTESVWIRMFRIFEGNEAERLNLLLLYVRVVISQQKWSKGFINYFIWIEFDYFNQILQPRWGSMRINREESLSPSSSLG